MSDIKNKEFLKQNIMEQERHLFVFGREGITRENFISELESDYPVVMDKESPMAIKLSDIGLPKVDVSNADKGRIDIVSVEYLNFSILSEILSKSKERYDLDILNDRLKKLIKAIDNTARTSDMSGVKNIEDLISIIEESKNFYKRYYVEVLSEGKSNLSVDDIALPFIQLEYIIEEIKRSYNNKSHFGIIIDKKEDIAASSTRAINFLVGARINNDISMKVFTDPEKWESFRDVNGRFVEYVHDYSTEELDDSFKKMVKNYKNNYLKL